MATTTSMPEPGPQASIGTIGRLTGALFSAKRTFADIAAKPSWVAPFILCCALGLVVGFLLGQKTDWRAFFERQMNQNPRAEQMAQDQKDRMLEAQTTWAPRISFAFGLVGTALTILVVALIYWGAFNLFFGAGLNFSQGFSITSFAFMPVAVSSVLAIITLSLKSRGDVDPEHFLVSNVAAFLADDAPKWLSTLGQSLDLFWIWCLALVAIGFAAATPKKIKTGSALGTVFGIWLIWVLARVGWAAL